MMATTHAYVALTLAVASLPVTAPRAPASSLLAAAFLGGLFPDIDLLADHRKTLHFPVLLPAAAAILAVLYWMSAHGGVLILAVAAAGAGLHAATDVLAGGVGYRPWENDSGRAVYNHVLGRWHAPRRLVRYSGAPEDFALGALFAVPAVLAPATGAAWDALLVGTLAGTGAFAAARRRLPILSARLRSALPATLLDRLQAGVRSD